ncbi:MAG TPA: hypothetical protein VLA06_06975 [Woeseiaceae bacterium]|jgi:hypothetical protein|nr:hypothetical protein [Woeseiaceae bacterium]
MIERRPKRAATAAILFVVWGACVGAASAETRFTRVDVADNGQARALQLGILTYTGDGVSVDLVSAIHIGDAAYYAELNDRFRVYDALLYELVAPQGIDINAQVARRKGLLSRAQVALTKALDLSFQLDEIDYGQPNFVHADLTPSEFRQSMVDRDESLYVYFWRIFFASVNEYARDPLGLNDWQVLAGMVTSGEDNTLKTMMAWEMTNLDAVQDIFGEDSDSAIVGARNEKAIAVLRSRMDAGDRRIGIFYGVAHMPDLEERLLGEVGLTYEKITWVDAWRLGGD